MNDPTSSSPRFGVEAALAQLEEERRKIDTMQQHMNEATTILQSKDRIFSVTFDGRGEIKKLAFDGVRYKKLAPGELAELVISTIASGRQKAIDNLGKVMGSDPLPGVSFSDLASGKSALTDVLDSFIGSAVGQLPEHLRGRVSQRLKDSGF
jgi:DNA-binding protein YbaB